MSEFVVSPPQQEEDFAKLDALELPPFESHIYDSKELYKLIQRIFSKGKMSWNSKPEEAECFVMNSDENEPINNIIDFVELNIGKSSLKQKEVCSNCAVLVECREFGIQFRPHDKGIYGGLSAKERSLELESRKLDDNESILI